MKYLNFFFAHLLIQFIETSLNALHLPIEVQHSVQLGSEVGKLIYLLNCLRHRIVSENAPTLRPVLTMMQNSKRAQIYTVCSLDHDLSFGTLITKIEAV